MALWAMDFAKEERATIAELRGEATELMSSVGLSERIGAGGDGVAGEDLKGFGGGEPVRSDAEFGG